MVVLMRLLLTGSAAREERCSTLQPFLFGMIREERLPTSPEGVERNADMRVVWVKGAAGPY